MKYLQSLIHSFFSAHRNWEKFVELLFAALFLACSVEIIKHYEHNVSPHFERLAFFVASNLASHEQNTSCEHKNCIIVAEITEQRFREVYRESSPIDRCQFIEDLNLIAMRLNPKALYVDYDLSPTIFDLNKIPQELIPSMQHEQACQSKLDLGLDGLSKKMHIALNDPLYTNQEQSSKVSNWIIERKASNIHFVDGKVEKSADLVIRYPVGERSTSTIMCEMMGCPNQSLDKHEDNDGAHEKESPYLNFSAATSNVGILAIENIATMKSPPQNTLVMVGGRYGKDDLFKTPLGEKYGIDLHAAAFASYTLPVSEVNKLVVLSIDILIGMIIGLMSNFAWEWLKNKPVSKKKIFPHIVFIAMAILTYFLVNLSLWGAMLMLSWWQIWLNPAPIVIGMIIHAFVMAPSESSEEHSHGEKSDSHPCKSHSEQSVSKAGIFSTVNRGIAYVFMPFSYLVVASIVIKGLFLYFN